MARKLRPTSCALEPKWIEEIEKLVATGKFDTRNHFIKQAIREKMQKEGVQIAKGTVC